ARTSRGSRRGARRAGRSRSRRGASRARYSVEARRRATRTYLAPIVRASRADNGAMWKVVALVLALVLLGHLALRYVRRNPLGPEVEGRQVVVTSQDYEVRFERSGPVEGTYFVSSAESRDFTDRPVNAVLWVIDAESARGYLRSYPDFHLYGSETGDRLRNVAAPIGIVAATVTSYADL